MGIEMKKGSKWWYARFRDGDKIRQVRLEVEIKGTRPPSLRKDGDRAFERSRGKAQNEFDRMLKDLRNERSAEKQLNRLVEIKTGREASFAQLKELPELWEDIPRRRQPNERYCSQCKTTLQKFADYMEEHHPQAVEFVAVTPEMAKAFMDAEEARGVSAKTWNDTLKLLRATFRHLHPQLSDASNPFRELVTKATETVSRTPFSVPEMQAILNAARDDEFIRPVVVTGMCTAMRRGDCCLLRWKDVDLKEGFITVKTSKTGETVDIPIFPMLREELGLARKAKGKSGYCFPALAEMYKDNPDGITWRVKKVLAKAFEKQDEANGKALPEASEGEVAKRGTAYLDKLPVGKKAGKMREVFDLYMKGKNINEVVEETGFSKGTVSLYLNQIEKNIGCKLVRGKKAGTKKKVLQTGRENGARRASVRDFHSFRVTWITLALAAGVPLELVQRVTGHRTVEVVLKHYFRPGREDFRKAIQKAMPKMLVEAPAEYRVDESPGEWLELALSNLDGMTGRNWKAKRASVAGLVRQVKGWYDGHVVREADVA